jgi:hypothetical protein
MARTTPMVQFGGFAFGIACGRSRSRYLEPLPVRAEPLGLCEDPRQALAAREYRTQVPEPGAGVRRALRRVHAGGRRGSGHGVVTAWWALPVRCALFDGFGVARRELTPAMRRRRSRRSWTRRNVKTSNTHAAAGGIVRAPRCLAVSPGFFLESDCGSFPIRCAPVPLHDTDLHLPRIALHGRRCVGCAGWPDRTDASSERPEAAVTRRLEGRGSSDQRARSAHVCMTTRACASHFEDLGPYIRPPYEPRALFFNCTPLILVLVQK